MITVKGLDKLKEKLGAAAAARIRRAAAVAINRTLYGAAEAEKRELRDSIDRPTPRIVNSIRYEKASPENLSSARVYISDDPFGMKSHLSPADVLRPHIQGGGRMRKSSERGLTSYLVPTSHVPRDAYGNVPGPYMNKVLSAAGLSERWAGHMSNQTAVSRKRNKSALRGVYVIPGVGIFQHTASLGDATGQRRRWATKHGGPSVPLFFFTRQPQYEKRYDFGWAVKRYFEENFRKNFADAWNR